MESIYFVLSWLCHRTCPHCYEDRFRPYYGADLEKVVSDSIRNIPRIIDNLPPRMTYLDTEDVDSHGRFREKRGRIIVAGGEILLEQVRETVLYPALTQMRHKYENSGGVELIVQTTGDILTQRHVGELLDRGVEVISVSGMDAYHAGFEDEAVRDKVKAKLTAVFESFRMEAWVPAPQRREGVRYYHFFGATPDAWIGKLWPRGRAHGNELSTATIADNFCNGWSGGLNFLQHGYRGSEVSIDPDGNVYPCCLKTKIPAGNLLTHELTVLLDSLVGNPVYEAISMGHPERMGIAHGWSVRKFYDKSTTVLPSGGVYQNLCIGCDRFHEEVLSGKPQSLVHISG